VDPATQYDLRTWPVLRERISACVRARPRAAWASVFDGSDACVAPVLTMSEAAQHPHLAARGTYVTVDGLLQAAPAPRFDRTPTDPPRRPPAVGADRAALADWGIPAAEVAGLVADGVLG
jgi:alpha-methylacyl-CoA racemase